MEAKNTQAKDVQELEKKNKRLEKELNIL